MLQSKAAAAVAGLVFVAWLLYLFWLWQPERQVRLHFLEFIEQAEKRDWDDVGELIAADYSDAWDFDREFVLREGREMLRHFFWIELEPRQLAVESADEAGRAAAVIRMSGSGTAIAQMILNEVNAIEEPFIFHWRKQSWKPWDWQLAALEHPTLEMRRYRSY